MSSEEHNFNLIRMHMAKGNFEKVYQIISENKFSDAERVLKLWDEAHYAEKEHETGYPLSALTKFRIREKYPPPQTVLNGNRPKATLPSETTSILKNWLRQHVTNPYPTRSEKQILAEQAKITLKQVDNWFANARRRNRSVLACKNKSNDDLDRSSNLESSGDQSDESSQTKSPTSLSHKKAQNVSWRQHNKHMAKSYSTAPESFPNFRGKNIKYQYVLDSVNDKFQANQPHAEEAQNYPYSLDIQNDDFGGPSTSGNIIQDVLIIDDSSSTEENETFLQIAYSNPVIALDVIEVMQQINYQTSNEI